MLRVAAADDQVAPGKGASDDERSCLNAVWNDAVFGAMQLLDAPNSNGGRTGAGCAFISIIDTTTASRSVISRLILTALRQWPWKNRGRGCLRTRMPQTPWLSLFVRNLASSQLGPLSRKEKKAAIVFAEADHPLFVIARDPERSLF